MSYSPKTYLAIRELFQRKTGLPAASLGIQHYWPNVDGGYHDGIDLLKRAGRYLGQANPGYSVRESHRDQPGTDGAAAIDIGWFDVVLPNGKRVTLITLNLWMERNWNAPDALWLREWIYSTDGRTVKRLDRLGKRTSGDRSHTTHGHGSGHRDEEETNKVGLFERFWREQEGVTSSTQGSKGVKEMSILARTKANPTIYIGNGFQSRTLSSMTQYNDYLAAGAVRLRDFDSDAEMFNVIGSPDNTILQRIESKQDQSLAKWAGEEARDAVGSAAIQVLTDTINSLKAGGSSLDAGVIIAEMQRLTLQSNAIVTALQNKIEELEARLARASQAEADAFSTEPDTN